MELITPPQESQNSAFAVKRPYGRTVLAATVAALVFFALDQLTKYWVISSISLHSRRIVIPGFFNLTYLRNPGAAWGFLAGRQWFLLVISLAAFAGIIIFFRKLTCGFPERVWALALVLSGIAGNCVDRFFRSEVVDFLEFHLGRFYWPAFNVADSCICTGVFLFIFSSLLRPEAAK